MATEKLKFKIELYAKYWDRKPNCTISINEDLKWSGDIDQSQDKPAVIEFEHECQESEKYQLILNRQGKDNLSLIHI